MKNYIYKTLTVFIVLVGLVACSESDLEPTIAQDKDVETSITTSESIQGIIYGAYNRLTDDTYYGRNSIIYGEVRGDNAFANGSSGRFVTAAAMDMGDTDGYAEDTWYQMYRVIASANIVIGTEDSDLEGDQDEIDHIIGQAYAIRALAHFDLLKLYGQQHVGGTLGIPYILEYKGSETLPTRNTVSEVQAYIEADITTALSLMSPSLNDSTKESMTTYAVQALKARYAIYFSEWSMAKTACEAIINSGQYSIAAEGSFVSTWYTDSQSNSIFELAFSSTDNQSINGLSYIYRGDNYGDIQALEDILTIFDDGDVRVSSDMIDYDDNGDLRNMGKYPSLDYSDNISIFRYEEVVLNYAEALYELNNSSTDALTYLNMIPNNRGANPYTSVSKDNLLQERRRELCFEGFRFDDLARTGSDIPLVSEFEQSHGGPTYGSYNYAFPIPNAELNANSNMVQNEGY